MTRELERVLRATFEDRTQPVPQQSDGLADAVIGRARGIRRRRALTGSASALVLVVLAGLGLAFGKMPFLAPEEHAPSGDSLPIPVIQGMDVAVPNPSDKSGPYLQAGDGTRVPLPKDQKLGDVVRVDGGFFAITNSEENGTLAFYPVGGPAKVFTDGRQLAMSVNAIAQQVAVTRADGDGVRLDVYGFDGTLVTSGQFGTGTGLGGWSGGLVMLTVGDALTGWDPLDKAEYVSPPDTPMRFMGSTTDGRTYVTVISKTEGTCLTKVDPFSGFRGDDYCYTEVPAEAVSVSPDGEWFVARGEYVPGDYRFVRVHMAQDFVSPGDGSMVSFNADGVTAWMWMTNEELVYESHGSWFKTNLYTMMTEPLPIPEDSSAYPIPPVATG